MKRSKVITQQPKTINTNTNIVDIKSVTTEHPKNSCKISKTTRQVKKVPKVSDAGKTSDRPLCSEAIKVKIFLIEKKIKRTK